MFFEKMLNKFIREFSFEIPLLNKKAQVFYPCTYFLLIMLNPVISSGTGSSM